ncbi:hypothetical protein EJ08DRAFT_730312 [Tothia fuscella]|uniref:Small ribosomal subunit protein mS29 n=1 Tax=Tothia fuscella TaxID=1048955 RepID=A0A9P4P1Q5_9PEZI|nr:hypothetical protein EJ08DRAFT_730312 [Tothia fuscella]
MPPRPCLRSLPLRIRDSNSIYTIPKDSRWLPATTQTSPFSTTSPNALPAPAKKKQSMEGPPKKGVRALRIKKKNFVASTAKPPAQGERKALRKRIVLSNTNAFEVPNLLDLNRENMVDTSIAGRVLGLPGELVDTLRAVEAFKVGQGWGYFRRPATLIRGEAVELGRLMEEVEIGSRGGESDKRTEFSGVGDHTGKTVRRLVHGERGVGKSVLLLQVMAMAFTRGWIVVNFPEARDLTIGHTDYAPIPNTTPTQYTQKIYTSTLLSQIIKANSSTLSKLQITLDHTSTIPIPIQSNISLDRFADLGAKNPDISWPIFQGLWRELMVPNLGRPPVFLGLDNISHILGESHYTTLNKKGKLQRIHAHDFVLVRHFVEFISGREEMGNGGLVMAATSMSDHAKSTALDVCITIAEARQISRSTTTTDNNPATLPITTVRGYLTNPSNPSMHTPIPTAESHPRDIAAYKLAQFYSPYKSVDERSVDALKDVETIKLEGLSKADAGRLMEYWARSGMVPKVVGEGFVGEKWSLSGGGVVGELERGVVRAGRL